MTSVFQGTPEISVTDIKKRKNCGQKESQLGCYCVDASLFMCVCVTEKCKKRVCVCLSALMHVCVK